MELFTITDLLLCSYLVIVCAERQQRICQCTHLLTTNCRLAVVWRRVGGWTKAAQLCWRRRRPTVLHKAPYQLVWKCVLDTTCWLHGALGSGKLCVTSKLQSDLFIDSYLHRTLFNSTMNNANTCFIIGPCYAANKSLLSVKYPYLTKDLI